MRWLNQLVMQVRMLLFRRMADTRLNEELRFHMEQQVAESRAAGLSEEEAHLTALREFGNPDLVREKIGATWNWNGLDQFCNRPVKSLLIGEFVRFTRAEDSCAHGAVADMLFIKRGALHKQALAAC